MRRVGSKCLVKPWIVKLFFGLALRLPGLFNDVFDDTKSEEDGDDNEHGDEATGEFKLVDRIRSPSPTRLPIPIISGRFRTFPSSDSYVIRISVVGNAPVLRDRLDELLDDDGVGDIDPDDDNEVDDGDNEAIFDSIQITD